LTSQTYRAATDASRPHLLAARRPSTMTPFTASSSRAAALVLVSMKAGVLSTPCVRLLTPQVSIARWALPCQAS